MNFFKIGCLIAIQTTIPYVFPMGKTPLELDQIAVTLPEETEVVHYIT